MKMKDILSKFLVILVLGIGGGIGGLLLQPTAASSRVAAFCEHDECYDGKKCMDAVHQETGCDMTGADECETYDCDETPE